VTDTADRKRPTPFILTVVATGANHQLYFKNQVKANQAFNSLMRARHDFLVALASTEGKPDAFGQDYEIVDDAGTRMLVALREFRSAQLADVTAEHWANAERKIVEAYVAVDFQNYVKENHASLTLLRAQPGGNGQIIQPR
jgi:hypothetical protein